MDGINKTDELQHWGIKGMRWGIRRSKKQLLKESGKKKAEMEGEKFLTSKKKSVSKLSDDELNKEIARRRLENELQKQKNDALNNENIRLQYEQTYANLNPAKLSLGQRIFNDIWPRAKKATLDAGETLLKDGLVTKGKELLGIDGKDPIESGWKTKDYDLANDIRKKQSNLEKLRNNIKNETDTAKKTALENERDELIEEIDYDLKIYGTTNNKKKK